MSNDPATTRTPCPAPDTLGRLLRDELAGAEAGVVEEHVGSCPDCQRVLQRLIGSLPGTLGAPPEGLASGDEPPTVPGHEILGVLGEGGMGVVYKALQTAVGRVVALKMIRGGLGSASERSRFRAEAEAAAKLTHPGIARVYEFGECAGALYFTLEFCDGGSLADKLDGTPWHPAAATRLTEMLADAVAAAHKLGIVHRDLKPANVLLASPQGPDGGTVTDPKARTLLYAALRAPHGAVPKVADFGISKRLDSPDGPTATGAVVGTPSYMSPEQASGESKRVGPPADVYALGAVLYELLTGRPPFKAQGVMETLDLVRNREPVAVRDLNPACPRDLETICLKCLQKTPEKRYTGAAELADDLRRFQENRPIVARPVGRAEQFAKWVKRNRGLSAGLAVAVMILVVGSVVSTVFGLESARQAKAAKDSADIADAKTEDAKKAQQEEMAARNKEIAARKKAEDAADQTQARLGRHFVENGQRLLRTDPFGSLLWFAEATKWDGANPERAGLHQMRAAAFLAQSPKLVHVIETRQGDGLLRYKMQFTPDGRRLITTTGKEACVWELSTGELAYDRIADAGWNRVSLSRDGRRLLVVSPDGSARLLDARTGKPIGEPLRIPSKIEVATFSTDGRLILCQSWGSKAGHCRVWDTETVKPVSPVIELPPPAGLGSSVQCHLSPDGKHVTTKTQGLQQLRVVATGAVVFEKKESERAYLLFTPDGKRLIFAGRNKLELLDPANGEVVATLHEIGALEDLYAHFSPDGRYMLAHASRSNTAGREVRVWDTANWKLPCEPLRCNSAARAHFTPDSRSVVTQSYTEVVVWDIATGRPRTPVLPMAGNFNTSDTLVSPDGRLIATYSDASVRVYDAATGDPLVPLLVHATAVRMMAFSPDGRFFATGGEDGVVRVWDLLPALEGPANALGTVPVAWPAAPDRVAFLSDGLGARTLAVVADAGMPPPGTNSLRIRDGATGKEIVPPIRHLERIWTTGFSPDGRHVLTLGGETAPPPDARSGLSPPVLGREARIWDAATGKPMTAPLTHTSTATVETRLSPNGRVAVTRAADGRVQLWDATRGSPTGMPLRVEAARLNVWFNDSGPEDVLLADDKGTLRGYAAIGFIPAIEFPHGARIRHAASASTSTAKSGYLRLVLTAGDDGQLRFWHSSSGKEARPPLKHDGPITHFDMSPRGLVVTASEDKTARVWDALKKDAGAIPPMKHDSEVIHASFSLDLKTVVALCKDGTVKLWDAAKGTPSEVQLKNPGPVREVWWSRRTGTQLITVGEKSARLWNTTDGEPIGSGIALDEKTLFAIDRSTSFLAPRALTLSPSGLAQAWDLGTGKPDGRAEQLKLEGVQIVGLAMFTDNRAVTADGTLWSWSPTRSQAPTSTRLAPLMTDARYTPDGNVVTSATDGSIRIWDVSGRMLRELRDTRPVQKIALSRDGRYVASLPYPKLWEVSMGKELPALQATHVSGTVEFSPDGDTVVTYGYSARLWSVRTGQPLSKEITHPFTIHTVESNLPVREVIFSTDGKRLLTVAYEDRSGGGIVSPPPKDPPKGEARVWDAATGEPVTPALRHKAGPVIRASFSPSGDMILTSGGGEARVWDATTGRPITPPLSSAGGVACFSPDGRLVVTVGDTPVQRLGRARTVYTVQVWESATGLPVTAPIPTDAVTAAAFSADGRFVILSNTQKVRVIDLRPSPLPPEDLLLHAQLSSGRSLDSSGDFVLYPAAGLLADFPALRARHPNDARFRVGDHSEWTRRQASEAELARNWPLARAHLDTLLAANPDDVTLVLRRAAVLAALGDWEAALADYDAAAARRNNDGPIWQERGLALAALERWNEAAESYTKAEERGVKNRSIRYQRAAAYTRLGRWDEASADLEVVLREPGADWAAYELRALVCLKRGDAEAYQKLCTGVLALTKNKDRSEQVHLLRICVLGPDALKDYGPLLDIAEHRSAPLAAAGVVRYRAGQFAVKGISLVAKTAGHSMGLTEIEYDLLGAMAYHRAGKPAEAKKMYDRALATLKQAQADGKRGTLYLPDARNQLRPLPWERQLGIELLRAECDHVLAEKGK